MGELNPRFTSDLNVPKTKPFSNDSWEASMSLNNAQIESEVEPVIYPAACRIVGLYPSITLNDASGLIVPTLDDIMILFNANQKRRYTANIGQTSQAQNGSGFVTLAALDTRIRDLNIVIDVSRPQTQFQARWKRFTQGTPIYRSVIVSLCLFVEIDD